jgi:hypothetical protein
MANSIIKPLHMDLIVERIYEGRCVPFLGAAANVNCEARGYNGLPLGAEVARELVKKIVDFKGRDPQDLARVALQFEFDSDRPHLISFLRIILSDRECEPSPLLKTLAKLPLKLIVTTNYDQLLERALNNEGKAFERIIQPAEGFENTPDIRERFEKIEGYEGLILYKIHGSFLNKLNGEEPSPIIITEDDYIEFLTVVGVEDVGVPRLILKKIIPSTLLFLGYSLEDWDFRTIYKGLIERLPKHQKRKSFAIQKDPSEFWVEFWQRKGVEIYDIDLYEFAEQLEKSYRAKYE